MKKRILFYISQFNKGGAELSLLELMKSLNRQEYEIDFIIYNQVPIPGTVSLIDDLPGNIHICNVYRKNHTRSKLQNKLRSLFIDGEEFDETAVRFVFGKEYDLAVHVGEWHNPDFIALIVKAAKKICWIHADIDKAPEFDADGFFSSFESIDCYYFVSRHSRESAENRYPFIKDKTGILHNLINRKQIMELSSAEPDILHGSGSLLFISVANIREEKGYIRSLEAITELRNKGYIVDWWIIGHPASEKIISEMESRITLNQMNGHIKFLGPKANPYCYMRQADAVLCLSDSESWSLVITESKLLGIPVIATNTSGAAEQIKNRITGLITSFDPIEISNKMMEVINKPEILSGIRRNLASSADLPDGEAEFLEIINTSSEPRIPERDILYVIDDVNYPGGAHRATIKNINYLISQGRKISVVSNTLPSSALRSALPGAYFYSFEYSEIAAQFRRRLAPGLFYSSLTGEEKRMRIQQFFDFRKKRVRSKTEELRLKFVKDLASSFEYVCVMSEGSEYKEAVSQSSAKKKIQWIHTDYLKWHVLNDYTRSLTANDYELWKRYDRIILLSDIFLPGFSYLYPELAPKCITCGNIIDVDEIRKKANESVKCSLSILIDCEDINYLEIEKSIAALKKLDESGYPVDCIFFHTEDGEALVPDSLSGKVIVLKKPMNMARLTKNKDLVIANKNNQNLSQYDLLDIPLHIVNDDLNKSLNYIIPNWATWSRASQKGIVSFVSCFRFEPIKQPLLIIKALKRVKECGYDFHWTFIGDGEQLEESKALTVSYDLQNEITFLGYCENPYPYIAKADFYVQFSKYEGLPNTIWEALALGVPVITSDIGAVKDQVFNEVTGMVIEPKLSSLIDALLVAADPDNRARFDKFRTTAMNTDYNGKDAITKQKLLSIFRPEESK